MGPQRGTPDTTPQHGWRLFLKRSFDLFVAAVVLLASAPAFAGIALLVWLDVGWPVFFRQTRPGRNGRPFTIAKFRTMREARDAQGSLLSDSDRLTRFGSFLRSTSLDELPQFFNVLRGELSLVGPRPLLMEYLERYTPEQARRHHVLPGITGWTQVNGRNALSWEQKFVLDCWYVDHWSLTLDLKILITTLFRVFQRKGISQAGHATMPEFLGTTPQRNVSDNPAGSK